MTMRRTAIFILVVVACAWIVSQWPIGDDEARPVNALSAAAVAPPQSTEVIGTGIAEVQRQAPSLGSATAPVGAKASAIAAALGPDPNAARNRAIEMGLYELSPVEFWDVLMRPESKKAKTFGFLPCLMATCSVYAKMLSSSRDGERLLGEFPKSPEDLAYLGAYCSPLARTYGYESLAGLRRDLESDAVCSLASETENVNAIMDGKLSGGDLSALMLPEQPYLTVKTAVAFALHEEAAISGIPWQDFRYELDASRKLLFSDLLALKFMCRQRGACAPMSPLLFALCDAQPSLSCKVGSDLYQIARDSLTAREYGWWDSAQPIARRKQR